MTAFYVTLSSDSSKKYFKDNTIAHFSTQLPYPICAAGHSFEVAVGEVFTPPSASGSKSPIFLYTDIIKPVIVSDTAARLLRVLTPNAEHHVFPELHYLPLEKQNICTVTLSFHTKNGERYPFQNSSHPAIIVLHFREIL
jgi:hypothetical protein